MEDRIVERIGREIGNADIVDILGTKLSPADLQSLLLHVYQKQAGKITPAQLLKNYLENRFVTPSVMDPTLSGKLDLLAISLLPAATQVLELSPVGPLGTCSALATVDQNKVVTTIRNTEVVADATNSLALECAKQRKTILDSRPKSIERIRLGASHRQLRAQAFCDEKYTSHFKVFCLCTAGRDEGGFSFEIDSLKEQIDFYVRFLRHVLKTSENSSRIEVFVSDFSGKKGDVLHSRLLQPLADRFPEVSFSFDSKRQGARNYYDPVCFNIRLDRGSGPHYDFLVDGGLVDWTQQLISSRKERLLVSGIGLELLSKIVPLHL